jgi:hypothetical protein
MCKISNIITIAKIYTKISCNFHKLRTIKGSKTEKEAQKTYIYLNNF